MFETDPNVWLQSFTAAWFFWIMGALSTIGQSWFYMPAILLLASVVGARDLAIGTGDTELYIFAGMLAAVVISLRVFLFRGAGKAS